MLLPLELGLPYARGSGAQDTPVGIQLPEVFRTKLAPDSAKRGSGTRHIFRILYSTLPTPASSVRLAVVMCGTFQLLFWSLKNNLQCPVEGYRLPAEAANGGRDVTRGRRRSSSGRTVRS